jgi:acetylxylan esterase
MVGPLFSRRDRNMDLPFNSVYVNDYYSQCLPGSSTVTSTTVTSTTATTKTTTSVTTTGTSAPAGPTPAQGYTQLTNFGSNPNNVLAWVYKPKVLANPPALIVAMHYCTGTAQAYYTGTKYASLAEQKGTSWILTIDIHDCRH